LLSILSFIWNWTPFLALAPSFLKGCAQTEQLSYHFFWQVVLIFLPLHNAQILARLPSSFFPSSLPRPLCLDFISSYDFFRGLEHKVTCTVRLSPPTFSPFVFSIGFTRFLTFYPFSFKTFPTVCESPPIGGVGAFLPVFFIFLPRGQNGSSFFVSLFLRDNYMSLPLHPRYRASLYFFPPFVNSLSSGLE